MKNYLLVKKIIIFLAIIALLGAWFISDKQKTNENTNNAKQYAGVLKQAYPQAEEFEKSSSDPLTFSAKDSNQKEIGFVAFGEANGYGGPLKIAVGIDLNGQIISTIVVEQKETPSYLGEVLRKGYLDKFKDAKVTSPFVLGEDLSGVSGATISSKAIAKAVRNASHAVGRGNLNLEIEEKSEPWNFGAAEAFVMFIFICAIIFPFFTKQLNLLFKRKLNLRLPIICCSIAVLGFWLNRPISMQYLTGAMLGFFPSIRENFLWYLILFTGIGLPLFTGKNIYCFWVCPFGGLQEIINKLCGVKYRLKIAKIFKVTRYFLLWLGVFLVIINNNPASGNIEPFGTVFGFKGTGFDWIKLIVVLVIAVFSYKFWCYFLCPIGAVMDLLSNVNHVVTKKLLQLYNRTVIQKSETISSSPKQ
ncbi:4Fe-4S binding protein [Dehalobacter sp. TBBPA1]|jgi:Na+-translocating ferredoxin:NAD+ oxidoreductase RnfG subunit|uniref:4Fe-4S binding protein n=1 Tax=Dehalobacter sp. TBBPA1 TaxID=3235037 RepID=UPI0034A31E12